MSDEVDQLLMLLNAHRRTTGIALVQRALAGTAHVAPSIEATISQGRIAIKNVKEALRSRNYEVEDVSIIDDANDIHIATPDEVRNLQDQITTLTNQTHTSDLHKYSSNKLSRVLLIIVVLLSGLLYWLIYERTQLLSTVNQKELQISSDNATQTAQQSEISTKRTEVALGSLSQTAQASEIAELQNNTTPSTATTTIINRDNLDSSDLFSSGANFSIESDKSIRLSGSWDQRIWLTSEMPRNFRATVVIKTQNAMTITIGLGNGKDLFPGFVFWLDSTETIFVDNPDQPHWNRLSHSKNTEDLIKANSRYLIIFERSNGIIKAYLNGSPILEPMTNKQLANENSYLFLSTNYQKDPSGILIEDITIEKIN